MRQDRARIGQQSAPRIGQLHAARLAPEQLHAQFLLQPANLLAERRLLHPQPFRRPRDVAFLGDRDEVAKVAQFHLPYPVDMDFA